MKNDHVTTKASISTLTRIIYSGMYNYGDANSLQYIFAREPTKTTKKSLPAVVWSGWPEFPDHCEYSSLGINANDTQR